MNQGVRRLDPVGLDNLGNQLLPQLGVGLPRRLALEILADGRPECVEALEIARLTGQGIVQRRQLLSLHLVQRNSYPAGLTAAGLFRMIVGKADIRLSGLAREQPHDLLFQLWNGLVLPQHQIVRLNRAGHSVLYRSDFHSNHLAWGRLGSLDGDPGSLVLLDSGQLLRHGLIGYGRYPPLQPEPPDSIQLQLRPHFYQQLELDRASLFEFQIANRGIGNRFERLTGLGGFPALPNHFFEHRLANGIAEALANDRIWRLPWSKSRQASPLRVVLKGPGLRLADAVNRYRHMQRLGGGIFGGLLDGDGAHCAGIYPDVDLRVNLDSTTPTVALRASGRSGPIAPQADLSQHSAALPGHSGPPGRLNPANPGLLNRPGLVASRCGARKGEAQCALTSQCFLRCCVPAVATPPSRPLPPRGLFKSEPRPRVNRRRRVIAIE